MKILVLQHIECETPGYIKDLMIEDGMNLGDEVGYNPSAKLLKENLTKDFTVSADKIPELEILKNLHLPLFETWRMDMVRESKKYGLEGFDYEEAKKLLEKFNMVCESLCLKQKVLQEKLNILTP